jgi:hypothetical protein
MNNKNLKIFGVANLFLITILVFAFFPIKSFACDFDCSLNINVSATKIICSYESDLPNWGAGGPNINENTASQFLSSHSNCHLEPGWKFQWATASVSDPGGSFVGEASGWNTFGPTSSDGKTTTIVSVGFFDKYFWMREVLKDGYIPFSGSDNSVSAEMYCGTDVLNYDNYDAVGVEEGSGFVDGSTYYCVAFNVSTTPTPPANTPPTITLIGANPLNITVGDIFADPGATAADLEDGNITSSISTTTNVNTSVAGSYTISYSVTDSGGLSTSTTRTVIVNPLVCTENCGPINTPPTITLVGANPLNINVGDIFTDPGATANDTEDGNLTSSISTTTNVNTAVAGTYNVNYSVTDSGGLSASASRTVVVNDVVVPPIPPVNPPIDNGGGGGGIGGHRHPVQGEVLGATSCMYLRDYLKIDRQNDEIEVLKLQSFLNVFEGESLSYTGIFDQTTFDAVARFQSKYSDDVLAPWGEKVTTGFVYILTKKKINEIYCNSIFPINATDQNEIDSFRNSGGSINNPSIIIGQSDIETINVSQEENIPENSQVVELKDNSATSTGSIARNAAISLFALPQKIFSNGRYLMMVLILIALAIAVISLFISKDDIEENAPIITTAEEEEKEEDEEFPVITLPGETLFPDEEIVVENPENEPEIMPEPEPMEEPKEEPEEPEIK